MGYNEGVDKIPTGGDPRIDARYAQRQKEASHDPCS